MMRKKPSFQDRVLRIVKGIPKGKTLTYKQVAVRASSPRAYRAVGNILKKYNPDVYGKLPCHRVVRSDGRPGGYRWGGERKKETLLWQEGHRRA